MLTVAVDDRPVDVAAVVERGRVLLPLRATFSALGATVGYDARHRIVVARTPGHELQLRLGSQTALVDARPVRLDVPARSVAGRAYVPLRFVAQALGAAVAFDSRTLFVSIRTRNAPLTTDGAQAAVTGLAPAPDAAVSSAYPTISASLASSGAQRPDVALFVDGQDVTPLATFDGSTITYMPRTALSRGRHTAVFSGRTSARARFSQTWSFSTTLDAPPEDPALPFSRFDYRFYASGNAFYAGQSMHFTLVAPPGGTARVQLCDMGFDYPLSNGGYGGTYQADIPAPFGYWIPSCPVVAIYTAWNGAQTYVPVPLTVAIFTLPAPAHRASPTPAPRRIEPAPRRAEPAPVPVRTPSAAAASAPQATAQPHAVRTMLPRPRATPL